MSLHRLALLLVLPACIIAVDDDDPACDGGKCDGVDQSCTDKRYADGVCHPQLDCPVPDLDCFRTFDDDAAGVAWFAALEPVAAAAEGRPARRVFGPGDPRFAKVRALLDRGWQAMRTQRPVGKLGDRRPALVFVEDPTVNAFVFPEDLEKHRASFAVMIHTATLDIPTSDDANLGLMMHELQHAVGLHVVEGVKERIERYYTASAAREPIGRHQADDPDVRQAATAWRERALEVGALVQPELRGFALQGVLGRVFRAAFSAGLQANPAACAHSRTVVNQLTLDIDATTDKLSGAPVLDASIGPRVTAALAAVRDECLPAYGKTFVQVLAELAGATPEQIEASLSADDRALIAGKHVVDAVAALAEHRRATMRGIEAAFRDHTGLPWSMLRFFSEEEDADDTSVTVLRGAALDPEGLGTFFLEVLMPADVRRACDAVLATGAVPPYGVDLLDTHHANCWRTHHIAAYATDTAKTGARTATRPRITLPAAALRAGLPLPPPPRFATY